MFNNYLKIAWRNLLRHKFYTLLNLVGLAVGLAFTLLIGSYIWGEYQVNQSLRHADRHYLIQSRWKQENQGTAITSLAPIGPALRAAYPQLVANYYRFHGVSATLSKGANHFRESMQIGDSTLLTMYGFRLLQGNPRTALAAPNAVVLTAAKARKLFGRTDVLNQSVTVETPQGGKQELLVTGVLDELPANSVSQLLTEANEVFLSLGSLPNFGSDLTSWLNPYVVNYIELQPGVTPQELARPMAQLIAANAPADVAHNLTAYATPLTDYYLQSNNGLVHRLIVTLALVASFILLMAIVNFVNLSTGSSAVRLREIGVRKALGGLRWQLTAQFMLEAVVLTALAAGLAVGLYLALRPVFADVVGKPLPPLQALPWHYSWLLPVLVVLVGALAGSYPALYLSAYSSVDSLKGKNRSESILFRRGLVTIQFAIAVFVFVGAVVVSRQVAFFVNADLGFRKEAVLTVSSLPRNWSPDGVARMEAARDRFARLPGVQAASLSYEIPNGNVGSSGNLYPEGRDSTQAVSVKLMTTDEHYAQTYQINLSSGRYFHQGQGRYDSTSLVLNDVAIRALGYRTAGAALGQTVRFQGNPRQFTIRGVVRRFHVGPLHQAIGPLAITQVRASSLYRFFSFRLAAGQSRQAVDQIGQTWREQFPDAPFDYAFMDQTLATLYRTERQLEKAAYVATGLALLLVLLGVAGLVSLSVAHRTKEVGIRKVLGASVPGIVGLFLNEYVWMLVLANALAWPVAYWAIVGWLANYAYHTPIGWQPFVGVALLLAGITALLIGLQIVRTALVNPIKSLRAE